MNDISATAEPSSLLELSDRVARGFPLSTLHEWHARIAPEDSAFLTRIVAAGTLKRRTKQRSALSPTESERLQRAIDAWRAAIDTYQTPELARTFLYKPHMLLDHKTPFEVALRNDPGLEAVRGILGRLKHGTAA